MSDINLMAAPSHTAETPSNLERVKRVYENWNNSKGKSSHEFLELFADDAEMASVLEPYEKGDPLAGLYSGKDKAEQYFRTLDENWAMIFYGADRYIVDPGGDDIIMIGRCHWRHRASGNEVNSPKVDIWHFENGKATSFFEMFDSLEFAAAVGQTSVEAGATSARRKLPQPEATLANPNLPALAEAYAQWSNTKGGNVEQILDLFAEGVEMNSVVKPERVPHELAGAHVGRDRARDYFGEITNNWEMCFFDVDRFVAHGDAVVMIGRCRWRNKDSGAEFETPKVDIHDFENGQVVRFLEMVDSLAVARAFGAV